MEDDSYAENVTIVALVSSIVLFIEVDYFWSDEPWSSTSSKQQIAVLKSLGAQSKINQFNGIFCDLGSMVLEHDVTWFEVSVDELVLS